MYEVEFDFEMMKKDGVLPVYEAVNDLRLAHGEITESHRLSAQKRWEEFREKYEIKSRI